MKSTKARAKEAAIKKAADIEAETVIHAEWTEEEQCSNCGHDAEFTEWTTERRTINENGDLVNIEYEVNRTYHLTKRCPNCGARMREKEANAYEESRNDQEHGQAARDPGSA